MMKPYCFICVLLHGLYAFPPGIHPLHNFFSRCVELDQNNSVAWMALATSYTNESYQTLACNALKVKKKYYCMKKKSIRLID